MVAAHHSEVARCVRELPLLDMLDPGTEHSYGHLVFFLAGHRAGVTSDTTILVNDKAVSHLVEIHPGAAFPHKHFGLDIIADPCAWHFASSHPANAGLRFSYCLDCRLR